MEKKKYELTDETIDVDGHVLHRIKAIRDFGYIKVGELGGFIEKGDNLSHNGKCWVSGNARVFDNARVFGNAKVSGNARVFDNARVSGNARVFGNARVYGDARVFGDAQVVDNVRVFGNAKVSGNARDNVEIYGTRVYGNAKIYGNAIISSNDDYITFGNIGSRHDTTTMFRCKGNMIYVSCGCFRGTLDEFHEKVIETHGDNKYAVEYQAIIKFAKIHFNLKRR